MHNVFTLREVSAYLHISEADVETLVRRCEIPFERQGPRVVFRQNDVDAWATQRIIRLEKTELTDYHKVSSARYHDLSNRHAIIPELIHESYVVPELASRTKPSLMRAMTDLAEATGLVIHPEELLESLIQRERIVSTALPGGIALLHPEHHLPYMFDDSFLVLGRTIQPIAFGCPSGETSDLFFLICSQDDRIHLHVLARLCMMCHQTRLVMELREAHTAREMLDALEHAEQEIIARL